MTSIIWDVKSIRLKLERQEQKADFDEKNPKVDPNKVVWSPEWGYGVMPFVSHDWDQGYSTAVPSDAD